LFARGKWFYKRPLVVFDIEHIHNSLLGIKNTQAAFIVGYWLKSAFLSCSVEHEKKSDDDQYQRRFEKFIEHGISLPGL
jgi:hypothetical protein